MMIRNFLRCRGCGGAFVARVEATPTDLTKFYVPCPLCHLPIRGRASGQELKDHRISFDCDTLDPETAELQADLRVVTINPYVPARYDADFDAPVGGFSMMTLLSLLGDERVQRYFEDEGTAQAIVDERWARIERLYEYYLDENWANFDRVGKELFDDWRIVTTAHERATLANQALGSVLALVNGSLSRSASDYFPSYLRKHTAALNTASYIIRLRSDFDAGMLQSLQRRIFDLLQLFISRFEMWKAGRLIRWVEPLSKLDDLTLFRDEFPEMRDLYQQAFELICKTLRFPIAAQNTVKQQDPDDFGSGHPDLAVLSERGRPTNLAKFERLANAHKVAYVALVPRWVGAAAVLDNRVRNTIGHASVRHDLRSGRVVSDADPTGVSYLEFLSKVHDMFEMLMLSLQVIRTARVASSPDFGGVLPPSRDTRR